MTINGIRLALLAGGAVGMALTATAASADPENFERLATYPVFFNLPEGVDPTSETVAQAIAATPDGMTLVYTDAARGSVGFVDISDPAAPAGEGSVDVGGVPTSVVIADRHAHVAVDTSGDPAATTGHVAVMNTQSRVTVATCPVDGQPTSIAVSPDGDFLAVAVASQRDPVLNPDAPAGNLAIFTLGANGRPDNCDVVTTVDLSGLADVSPADPAPEHVDVNADDFAVVTLQKNNHVVLVDLATAAVAAHFPAGAVDLTAIDVVEDGIVAGTGSLQDVVREPDGVSWLGSGRLVTANEGADQGGSRGFTVFDIYGGVLFDSAELMEHLGMALGHYPERRAEDRGIEPEGVEVARFGDETLVFVSSSSGNFVAVFADEDDFDGNGDADLSSDDDGLELVDVLPTAVGPEGLLAIPARDLFVVATEVDAEGDGLRATLSLYGRSAEEPVYPMLVSDTDPATGAPIGWGAMSGLAADPQDPDTVFAVNDSFYAASRIYTVDVGEEPARITGFVDLTLDGALKGYDLEGVAVRPGGGFWAVSEGRLDRGRNNLLLQVAADGTVEAEIKLPAEFEENYWVRFGFEGVAVWGDKAIIAIQRTWRDDPTNHVKLAIYDPATAEWTFVRYRKAVPTSPRGGWVGLSEITAIGDDRFLIIERDNQPGIYSTHKVVTEISLAGIEPVPFDGDLPVVESTFVVDLLPVMRAGNGWISDKPEGLAVTADGRVLMVTDNDGVDDANGETQFQLLNLGTLDEMM